MVKKRMIQIESREHLLSTLGEAAELEHTLMCQYLYAVFSLKSSKNEDLSDAEWDAVKRWKKVLLNVCVEEMGHLALVCNLITVTGGYARFLRPSFPVRSGLFPEDFVLQLSPLSLDTLDHFIFLERPDDVPVQDSPLFEPEDTVKRSSVPGRLTSNVGDYTKVGELYDAVMRGIHRLSRDLGEENLFCGSRSLQLGPDDIELEGLDIVQHKAGALKSILLIVEQGEGARSIENSHFEKFSNIKKEYEELLKKNPKFTPSRNVASNPVMLHPIDPDGKTWINEPTAAIVLDLANALYSLMLQILLQIYSVENRPLEMKRAMINGAFTLMHSLGIISEVLTRLKASPEPSSDVCAGMTFDLNRNFGPVQLSHERCMISERIHLIQDVISTLTNFPSLKKISEDLEKFKSSVQAA
jgi:hypothetical protein